jgi:hemolysin activation/secretion protein
LPSLAGVVSFQTNLLVLSARALAAAVLAPRAPAGCIGLPKVECRIRRSLARAFFTIGFIVGLLTGTSAPAADFPGETNAPPHFDVETYDVEGGPKLSMDAVFPILSKYTGTNVSLEEVCEAAFALQAECRKEGYSMASVAIARERITNGVVTMNVFKSAIPQIVISGIRYFSPSNSAEIPAYSAPVEAAPRPAPAQAVANAPSLPPQPPVYHPPKRGTPEQIAVARQHLFEEMARLQAEEKDHRIHVVSTNAAGYDIEHYVILGNTVLTPQTIAATLTNIDGAFGTNVSFAGVQTVVEQLQQAYHDRGYETVSVKVPRQTLANATVKLQVLEGRLEKINVAGNRYFSSNNVMASLPSLHPNMVLNVPVFNAELSRANLNQERQIYPVIGPGTNFGESQLTLNVKDRPPVHGKLELDNQSSPGTPDLRVNSSAIYDNLWQDENALGVQYGFSPERYKEGAQWPFYDQPLVADYSGFYRLPLGSPESIGETVAGNPSFGYDEATRQFRLPPPSGQPELTLYANRATIDTGLQNLSTTAIIPPTPTNQSSFIKENLHQDITVNQDFGFQLSKSLPEVDGIFSVFSGGLDVKVFSLNSYGTNLFVSTTVNTNGQVTGISKNLGLLANTESRLEYLPISLNYNANFADALGPASVGLGLSANLWYSANYVDEYPNNTNIVQTSTRGHAALAQIVNAARATGHWVILRPSFSQEFQFYTNWTTTFRLDGQWASEPLVSIEQFGAGGVNSVPGYHEGEVFGDDGWHVGLEQQTAPLIVGDVYDGTPLALRASAYVDYARVYLINAPGSTPLCGAGFGIEASIGPSWQAQLLCSWPLLTAGTVQAYQPFFNFDLTAQF